MLATAPLGTGLRRQDDAAPAVRDDALVDLHRTVGASTEGGVAAGREEVEEQDSETPQVHSGAMAVPQHLLWRGIPGRGTTGAERRRGL